MRVTTAAVVRVTGGPFEFADVHVDAPRTGEVLVRVVATGVCHTDLLARDGLLPPAAPAILGHEGSGVVEAVGDGVTSVATGDRVVLCPISCGRCRTCRTGHPMHCAAFLPLNLRGRRPDGSTAYRDVDGTELNGHFFGQSAFAGHVVVGERSVVPVTGDVPLALLGPLGCGVQTGAGAVFEALRPPPGSTIAVLGAGAVGLSAVMAARVAGCAEIIAFDRHRHRLDLALELGATQVVVADNGAAAAIMAANGGGVDFAIDAVGLPATTRIAVDILAMGGTAGLLGSAGTGQDVALSLTGLFGRTVRGILEGDCVPAVVIPTLIRLYRAGRFPFDRLVREYPVADIARAVADAESGAVVKPVLVW